MRWIKTYKYALVWSAVVVLLSSLPSKEFENKQMDGFDLAIHFVFYGVLCWLVALANVRYKQEISRNFYPLLTAIISSIILGGLVEVLQGTVFVSRTMDWYDFIANSCGALVAALVFRLVYGSTDLYC